MASLKANHRPNRLLAAMEHEDFTRIDSQLDIADLPRGKVLYEIGESIQYGYFPHDAVVSLLAVMKDGASAEMAVFGCEGVCGFISASVSRRSFGRYVVQVPGRASRIAVEPLQAAFDASMPLRELLRRYTEALLTQTFQTVACNALHNVEAHCCRWILSTHDRVKRDTLPLTHEFLAEMLGVQRSTLSIITRTLQTAGLISQSRACITVQDRASLEDVACECYRTVRRNFERLLPKTHSHG
ncbi:Crp/Fnr family transcriptional regulator [Microvirga massiliensis]|uniref:Crp/Fnr family transcriptional regulator n=1 Tax=Microvirga massiliensis TaxID=1033741 RepID=UPI00062B64E0|nr:Crp/Fnr family transcriptional regulator [Microvirga massiliensis]